MEIATFINDDGQIAGFWEKGAICLYCQDNGSWKIKKKIDFVLSNSPQIGVVKDNIKQAVSQLTGCEVFIVRELKGAMHVFLEELGFRVWKSAGTVIEQLDYVAKKDAESAAERALSKNMSCSSGCGSGCGGSTKSQGQTAGTNCTIPKPMPVGEISDGFFRINLAEALAADSTLNSMQVLIPFMEKTDFKKLEIYCEHIPRWFDRVMKELNMIVESNVPDTSGQGITLLVVPEKRG
jgi:Fe-only nitrogenase accessory protein AnfO